MKRLRFLLLAFLSLSWCSLVAQTTSIKGVVLSESDKEAIIGATIMIEGTSIGGTTDYNGNFTITNIPTSAKKIVVSYIGMETKTLPLKSTPYEIFLKTDNQLLDEVVIQAAYGAQKKSSVTGAISTVGSEKIEQRPISSISDVLEGSSSGIQVTSTGGPGSSPSIRIRGFGSVNGSNSPLYVLDGVPMNGNISDVNPNDIESISVLKDAASAALFGNKAANGVILINTKRGKSDKVSFKISMNQGIYDRAVPEYSTVGDRDFMNMMWTGYRNSLYYSGKNPIALEEANQLASNQLIEQVLKYNIYDKADTELFDANGKLRSDARMLPGYKDDRDWFKHMERLGHRQEYNVSGGASNEKGNYYLSLGYLNEQGYIKTQEFDRLSARANVNITPVKWFKTGLNLSASHQKRKLHSSGDFANPFNYARKISPIYPVHLHDMETGEYIKDENGGLIYDDGTINGRDQYSGRHVIWENELNKNRSFRNTINSQVYADVRFLSDFTFTVRGDINLINHEFQGYDNPIIGDALEMGRAEREMVRRKGFTFQQQLDWNKLLFEKHHVNILVGHENYTYSYNTLKGKKSNEIYPNNTVLDNFSQITALTDYLNRYKTESYLSRLRYNYDERYFGEFSFRRDGSSRFHPDNRWGNFWSVGGSWMISKEKFMKPYRDVVNDLKFRASYGEVGNDASVGYYGYMSIYSSLQNNNLGAAYKSQLGNDDIKWETTQSLGIALEGRFWNRLNASIEYFDKRSKDLLFDVNLPLSVGATSSTSAKATITKNLGTVSNRGFEINADIDVIKTKDWTWNVGTNGTFLKNKILTLPKENRKNGIIAGSKRYVEGRSVYDFWQYKFEGVDQMTGTSLYILDRDKFYLKGEEQEAGKKEMPNENYIKIHDKEYTNNTTYSKRQWAGSAIPKWFGSVNSSVRWKDLTFSALLTYSIGGKILDNSYRSLMSVSDNPSAIHKDMLKSWNGIPEGMTEDSPNRIDKKGLPRLDYTENSNLNSNSDRFLHNASYLNIKSISVAYKLPKTITKKLNVSKIAVNMAIENLHIFSAIKGMDPQQSFGGVNTDSSVSSRVLSFGLNVNL